MTIEMRLRQVLAAWLLLVSLRGTHAQIIFPGSSGVRQDQTNDESHLESALQTAVNGDRLDRSNEAFYATVFNLLTPRCSVPTGGIGSCGRLSQCPYLVPYVRRLGEPDYFKFVKRHICSIQGTSIYLCCPFQAPQFQQPPQSPKTPNASPQSSQVQPPQNGGFNNQLGFSRPSSSTGGVAPGGTKSAGNTFGGSPNTIANICGLSNEIRVVGGQPIEPGSWPWLAAIGFSAPEGRFLVGCGGSLITTRHVLTAAHCFADHDLTHVRLGEHDTESNNDGAQPIDFRIVRHVNPGYNKITKLNDIELLTLDRTVVFTDYIRPACLPSRSLSPNHFQNAQFGIVGWGATAEGYRGSNVPQAAQIFNVEINKCAAQYASFIRVDSLTMMCAARSGTDACQGDSGGPLHYLSVEAGRYYLVGVVSFGKGCARPDFPGVYTRVDAFLPWINQAIRNS